VTYGGKSFYIYLNVVHFFNTNVNLHLMQLKPIVFLHRCLICTVPGNIKGESITVQLTCLTGLH